MDPKVQKKIEDFFSQYRARKYAKGQVLLLNGDDVDFVYHLLNGRVKQYDVTYRGDEIVLNVFKPPAFFPMSVAINNTPNKYIYEAETDIEIKQAPAPEVVEFIQQNPEVMFDLLGRLYSGVEGLLGRMVYLMAGSAKSRLIYELIIEARRFGVGQGDNGLTIGLNEKELGARAGLSRETVSREMQKLKEDKLVAIDGKKISINDLKALEERLGQET